MDAADLLRAPGDGRTSAHSRVIISFMFLTRPFSGGCLISVSGADGPPGRAGVSSHCQVVSKRHVPLDAFYFLTARLRRGRKKKKEKLDLEQSMNPRLDGGEIQAPVL